MLLKLALRNIFRHGKNSLLVVLFMCTIGVVFMTGTSLFVTVNQSMKQGFRNSITGDYAVMSHSHEPMSLFGATIPAISEFFHLPRLKNQSEIEEILLDFPEVEQWTNIISGNAVLDIDNFREGVPFFGVDFEEYRDFFPELEWVEYQENPLEEGLCISENFLQYIERNSKIHLGLGDELKLTTLGGTGFKIRQVPIRGIYRYPFDGPLVDRVILLDQKHARSLVSVLGSQVRQTSPEESSDLLDMDLDSFFTDNQEEADSSDEKEDILSSLEEFLQMEPLQSTDDGSWHFMLIRLKNSASYSRTTRKLEGNLKHLDLDVLNWRQAAGQNASYAFLLQIFFYGGFILILLAGIIGIINMMLIALYDRIREIGTMQALGVDQCFILKLMSCEYALLTLMATLLSLCICYLLFHYLNIREIKLNNSLLLLIFGGKALSFPFTFPTSLATLMIILFSGVISAVFPIIQALKMEPVDALKGNVL